MSVYTKKFFDSLKTLQADTVNQANASFELRSVLSGVNQQLTYGVSNLPITSTGFIRNRDGRTYFMIGYDTVGNNSVVKK